MTDSELRAEASEAASRSGDGNPAHDEYPALVRAAQSGDRAALERLLARAQAAAWRFSVMSCGHTDDAEDVMQDALLRTYRYAARIREPEAFRAWLYRTVRNACLVSRRRRAGEPARMLSIEDDGEGHDRPPFEAADPGPGPEQVAQQHRVRQQLVQALQTLPPTWRGVIVLRDLEGLSTREVAQVLDISEANVKQRLHRARAALKKTLNGAAPGGTAPLP
jgi:RNA polymerase sigma-70 factor (ECF subfamily)